MAAVIELNSAQRLTGTDSASAAASRPISRPASLPPESKPALRVIHGGRSSQVLQLRRMYLRRRLFVVSLLVVLVLAAVQLVGLAWSGLTASAATGPVAEQFYEVRSGDSLWSIAGQVLPGGDRRDAVDQLVGANPTVADSAGTIQAGDILRVPQS